MSKLNTPWRLDADAIRDATGRIVIDRMDVGDPQALHIVECVNRCATADDQQATNHCPLCEGYAKRIAELEAERDALKAELKAACTVTFEAEMGECQGDESAVPFEEHAEAVEDAYKEGIYDARSLYPRWAMSNAKTRLDERRKEV